MVVHILKHGQALCGRPGVPASWPEDHKWVSFEDEAMLKKAAPSLCAGCKKEHKWP